MRYVHFFTPPYKISFISYTANKDLGFLRRLKEEVNGFLSKSKIRGLKSKIRRFLEKEKAVCLQHTALRRAFQLTRLSEFIGKQVNSYEVV